MVSLYASVIFRGLFAQLSRRKFRRSGVGNDHDTPHDTDSILANDNDHVSDNDNDTDYDTE